MNDVQVAQPSVDRITMVGLSLLVGPLTTLAHELLGHGGACVAVGGRISSLGAFYLDCAGATGMAARIVAMAGTGMDVAVFLLAYAVWRHARSDLARLASWLVFTVKGMVAAGYFLFSGVSGLGDWGPGPGGGIGPLPHEGAIRVGLFLVGLVAYIALTKFAMAALRTMIGGGPEVFATRKAIALDFYIVHGVGAVLVGLLNPVGIFVVLASAAASSFGGTAGMFNVAFDRSAGEPRHFVVRRNMPVLIAGLLCITAFAVVLGPTLRFPA